MTASPLLGIVGAGQLGRMLHQAAIGPGLALRFLATSADEPAAAVHPSHRIGTATSADDLTAFAAEVDVVSFEHEVVDVDALDQLTTAGVVVRPSAATLRTVADKLSMRAAVAAADLPSPGWCRAETVDEVLAATKQWPNAVIKPSRGGYDGRGVFMVDAHTDVAGLAGQLLDTGVALLVEPRLAFECELSVIVARRPGGETVVYDPVRTLQVDGQCRQVTVPCGLDPQIVAEARQIALAAADALDVVGLLAVELFLVEGRLLVNEFAVRPHNSGHHTIEAAVTSQFENHLRAVADLPLGDPGLAVPAAAMVNVIGAADGSDPRERLGDAMAVDPAAHIHLYGKVPRPERKVGHVTVCGATAAEAGDRAWAVVAALGGAVRRSETTEPREDVAV